MAHSNFNLTSVAEDRRLLEQEGLDLSGEDQGEESKMSCNGCRVLRKGCSKTCELRSCLRLIDSPEAQANATLFLAEFFGRTHLLSFISAVPDHERPALFKSLLYEACGRTVNPVHGATGLFATGKWNVCEGAVQTVLSGGVPVPIQGLKAALPMPIYKETSLAPNNETCTELIAARLIYPSSPFAVKAREYQPSEFGNLSKAKLSESETGSCSHGGRKELKLLNLFV